MNSDSLIIHRGLGTKTSKARALSRGAQQQESRREPQAEVAAPGGEPAALTPHSTTEPRGQAPGPFPSFPTGHNTLGGQIPARRNRHGGSAWKQLPLTLSEFIYFCKVCLYRGLFGSEQFPQRNEWAWGEALHVESSCVLEGWRLLLLRQFNSAKLCDSVNAPDRF